MHTLICSQTGETALSSMAKPTSQRVPLLGFGSSACVHNIKAGAAKCNHAHRTGSQRIRMAEAEYESNMGGNTCEYRRNCHAARRKQVTAAICESVGAIFLLDPAAPRPYAMQQENTSFEIFGLKAALLIRGLGRRKRSPTNKGMKKSLKDCESHQEAQGRSRIPKRSVSKGRKMPSYHII